MSVAILFSPQGSQVVGMGRALAERHPPSRAVYDAADMALGWSVSSVCWEGPAAQLDETRQTQPCVVATSLACWQALLSAAGTHDAPIEPAFVAGHSVGEYAALVAAGVVSLPDALRLVALRGALMAAAATEDGGMAAVLGLERDAVETAVAAVARPTELVVANDNAPGQVVISGALRAIESAGPVLREAGARRIVLLKVSGAFHSPAMAPVGERLTAAFAEITWSAADPPLVSNVTGAPERDPRRIRDLLVRQVRSPVEWVASVRRMVQAGVDCMIECGPGAALTGMVRRIAPQVTTLNVNDPASLEATLADLSSRAPNAAAGAPAVASTAPHRERAVRAPAPPGRG